MLANEHLRLFTKYAEYFSKACPSIEPAPEAFHSGLGPRRQEYEMLTIEFQVEHYVIWSLCRLDLGTGHRGLRALTQLLTLSHRELIYLNTALQKRLSELAERLPTTIEYGSSVNTLGGSRCDDDADMRFIANSKYEE